MNEHIVDISNIEDLIITKYLLEKRIYKDDYESRRGSLNDFLNDFLDMQRTSVIYDINERPKVISFYIYDIKDEQGDDRYIFVPDNSEYSKITIERLRKINYDISKLNPYTNSSDMLVVNNKSFNF